MLIPSLKDCIRVCGPPMKWRGHCFHVAITINRELQLGLRERYGIYHGPVRQGFFNSGRPHRHGWLQDERSKRIVDPTRWVFENRKPYIFVGDEPCTCSDFVNDSEDSLDSCCSFCGHVVEEHEQGFFRQCTVGNLSDYDLGGERFRNQNRDTTPPKAEGSKETCRVEVESGPARNYVRKMFPNYPDLELPQIFFLANKGPVELESLARPIYSALIEAGHRGKIPIDFAAVVFSDDLMQVDYEPFYKPRKARKKV